MRLKHIIHLALCAVTVVFAWHVSAAASQPETTPAGAHKPGLVAFNQKFIDGLYADTNLQDPDAVFKLVFSQLDDQVTVYPTENYYYFSFNASGKTLWGNLRLEINERDPGVIYLGFFHYDENGRYQDRTGNVKAFSAGDGVLVKRLERFLYAVEYGGKKVLFRLNDIGMSPPRMARLREDELFVGPIFDESGMKFFLIYNKVEKHFLYLLNEEGFTPEEFVPVQDEVVTGKRTGFAFYQDKANNRKILIAVHGKNTDRNNYYDGPFDQLPDNYADETYIQKYIEEAYPYTRGIIDKYGVFTTQQGARAVVAPYNVYYKEEDLAFVDSCKASNLSAAKFYACITPDFYQQMESAN